MNNPFKCVGKEEHDFSYKGKKTIAQIHCNNCGIKITDWVSNCSEWQNTQAQEDCDKENVK